MIGKLVLLRAGTGVDGLGALYSRCAEESYCQAELLMLLEDAKTSLDIPAGKTLIGLYDLDTSYTVEEFLRSFKGRRERLWKLQGIRKALLATPTIWNFVGKELTEVPGLGRPAEHQDRPAYATLMKGIGFKGKELEAWIEKGNDAPPKEVP